MVVFFSFWGRAYGRTHLGRIQGAAQAMTVFASAIGPLLLAWCVEATGSYAAAFYALAGHADAADAGRAGQCPKVPATVPDASRRPNEPASRRAADVRAFRRAARGRPCGNRPRPASRSRIT